MGDFEKRIESEGYGASYVSNEDLVCADCLFALDKSAICEVYDDMKPQEVLNGGECSVKVSESEVQFNEQG